jgi:type I restriction enzyme M protein
MLINGGRSATIVPDGVLFGSSTAHVALRKVLLDHNQLEAVISLPSGVFKPYAGVSTGILVFTKGGRTDDVFFYDVEADGLSLDDKRDPVDANDLPTCLAAWRARDAKRDTDRAQKAFMVPAKDIREANYDLSLSRYKVRPQVAQEYDAPPVILDRMKKLNDDIAADLAELEEMLA